MTEVKTEDSKVCPYCGKEFSNEEQRFKHQSEHFSPEDNKKQTSSDTGVDTGKNLINQWQQEARQ